MEYVKRSNSKMQQQKPISSSFDKGKAYSHISRKRTDDFINLSQECGSYDELDHQKYDYIESVGAGCV